MYSCGQWLATIGIPQHQTPLSLQPYAHWEQQPSVTPGRQCIVGTVSQIHWWEYDLSGVHTCSCVDSVSVGPLQFPSNQRPTMTCAVHLDSIGRLVCGHDNGTIVMFYPAQVATMLLLSLRRLPKGSHHMIITW